MTKALPQHVKGVVVAAEAEATGEPTDLPYIVLLLVDTFRADRLGIYGYERPTSPEIDALAGPLTDGLDQVDESQNRLGVDGNNAVTFANAGQRGGLVFDRIIEDDGWCTRQEPETIEQQPRLG